jgi:hypothetical protein
MSPRHFALCDWQRILGIRDASTRMAKKNLFSENLQAE